MQHLDVLFWQVREEQVPLKNFDASFNRKGLLAEILSGKVSKNSLAAKMDIAGQLEGMVREIKGKEIVVSSGKAAETMKMGDKLFLVMSGEKVNLEVTFPMMTVARCILQGNSAKYQGKISLGNPVFK